MRTDEATTAFVSDDDSSLKSDDCSGSNRVKYLYSYGGKILPRPGDGKLRYVGGETRVMAADRSISFADLIAKMAEVLGCDVLLKCQLPGEDLDALVSIKSDEELESILEEYDRLGTKLRVFLFPKPANPCRAVALSGPSMPAVAASRTVARGSGGHMKAESVTICSTPRISQTLQGLEKHSCTALNPLPRIRFARKAAKESSYRKAAAFNCISKNPYQGGGLAGYRAHPQFLVQY
ncbi:hypothetical protein SUGI_0645720 [Cryptomeria japonica]|uniref:uncharacterized protein LOC131041275 n=1 Tax=Cryptomeria japonica TaxID=3369 RepID=UPI002414B6D2|nr:uncharacterized protein LOC131041275 [Cryptomeria japonica]GLJ32065.1 hypothetical protein SUGI_0645720 [Cryptomeria japonica]